MISLHPHQVKHELQLATVPRTPCFDWSNLKPLYQHTNATREGCMLLTKSKTTVVYTYTQSKLGKLKISTCNLNFNNILREILQQLTNFPVTFCKHTHVQVYIRIHIQCYMYTHCTPPTSSTPTTHTHTHTHTHSPRGSFHTSHLISMYIHIHVSLWLLLVPGLRSHFTFGLLNPHAFLRLCRRYQSGLSFGMWIQAFVSFRNHLALTHTHADAYTYLYM